MPDKKVLATDNDGPKSKECGLLPAEHEDNQTTEKIASDFDNVDEQTAAIVEKCFVKAEKDFSLVSTSLCEVFEQPDVKVGSKAPKLNEKVLATGKDDSCSRECGLLSTERENYQTVEKITSDCVIAEEEAASITEKCFVKSEKDMSPVSSSICELFEQPDVKVGSKALKQQPQHISLPINRDAQVDSVLTTKKDESPPSKYNLATKGPKLVAEIEGPSNTIENLDQSNIVKRKKNLKSVIFKMLKKVKSPLGKTNASNRVGNPEIKDGASKVRYYSCLKKPKILSAL